MNQAIDSQALVKLQQTTPNLTIIDVREIEEFTDFRIPGAINLPLSTLSCDDLECYRDAAAKGHVVVVCRSGGRSQKAIERAQSWGIHGAINLSDGTIGWAEAGYPLASG